MNNNIAIIAAALTVASITDFLDAYPVSVEKESNHLKITDKENTSILLPLADSKNVAAGEIRLKNLFEFLDLENIETVISDWNMHVERETAIASAPSIMPFPCDHTDHDDNFGPREKEIIEINETLPAPISEI